MDTGTAYGGIKVDLNFVRIFEYNNKHNKPH